LEKGGFSRIPDVFRGVELLAGDMERLETLCHRVEQTYSVIHPYTSLIADSHEESTVRKKQSRRHLRTHK
jgi:hypothetical protein